MTETGAARAGMVEFEACCQAWVCIRSFAATSHVQFVGGRRRLIISIARWFVMLLPLCAVYAHADSPSWKGVWKGTLGRQTITACYDTADYGFYYYDKYASPIHLSTYAEASRPAGAVAQHRFQETLPSQPQDQVSGIWTITAVGSDQLTGTWTDRGKQLAIRLNRVESSGDCNDKLFVDGIHFPVTNTEVDDVSGDHYLLVSYRNADEFRSGRFNLLTQLPGKDRITTKINADLLKVMPDQPNECSSGDDKAGADTESPGSGELEPVFLTEHWVYVSWTYTPGSCGERAIDEHGSALWNRMTGDKTIDLWSWFGSGKESVSKPLQAIVAKQMESDSVQANKSNTVMRTCPVPKQIDDEVDVSMDTNGFIFWLEANSYDPWCEEVPVPFDEITPLLNDKGRSIVASIRADLDHHP